MAEHLTLGAHDSAQALVLGFPGPALVASAEGDILCANASASGVLTYSGPLGVRIRDELLSRTCAVVERRLPDRWSFSLDDASQGRSRSFLMAGVPIARGPDGKPCATVLAWETTVESHLRAALAESRAFYRDLSESCGEFVWSIDRAGVFNYATEEGIAGISGRDIYGTHWPSLFADNGQHAAAAAVFQARAPLDDVELWLDRGGQRYCLNFSVRPKFGAAGDWLGCRGVARDVTRLKQREADAGKWRDAEMRLNTVFRHFRERVEPRDMLESAAKAAVDAARLTSCWIFQRKFGRPFSLTDLVTTHIVPRRLAEESLAQTTTAIRALVEKAAADPAGADHSGREGAWQFLVRPVVFGGQLMGVLCFGRYGGGEGGDLASDNEWDEVDRHFLAQFGDQVAVAIAQIEQHEKLRRLSHTDSLTGLVNRRAFMTEARRRLEHHRRKHCRSAILFIDVDNFKHINDTGGHRLGDEVLKGLSSMIVSKTRGSDIPVRFGGDEFGLWLEEADETVAALKAADLIEGCHALNDAIAAARGEPVPEVGISIGIAVFDPDRPDTLDELIGRADKALYAAKSAGKNAYRTAPPDDGLEVRAG